MKIFSFISLTEVKQNLKPGDIIEYWSYGKIVYREIFVEPGEPDIRYLECKTYGIIENSYKNKLSSIGISTGDLSRYKFYIF